MTTQKKPLITKNLDIEGLEISRVARQVMQYKLIKFGNIGGGAQLRDIASLIFEHHFGAMVANITVKHATKINKLRQLISKVRRR